MFRSRTVLASALAFGFLAGCHVYENPNRRIGRQLAVVDAMFERDYTRLRGLAATVNLEETTEIGRNALDYAADEGDLRASNSCWPQGPSQTPREALHYVAQPVSRTTSRS